MKNQKRIFLYGFKPYRKHTTNITEEIVHAFSRESHIDTHVFDVTFKKNNFLDAYIKYTPDVIVGLGQFSRGNTVRVERKAYNIFRINPQDRPTKIVKEGASFIFSTLQMTVPESGRRSYYAGEYVCNYSMYIFLDYLKKEPVQYGFMHIPQSINTRKAVSTVRAILTNIHQS
ncbi:hypothetical protein KKH43_01155 [Patescibacteria group bacterium]|nr:hypothetical protein [Patescibacteria group bacterium]